MEEMAKIITILGVVSSIESNLFNSQIDHFLDVKRHCVLVTDANVILRHIFDTIGLASASKLLDHLE